MKIGVLALQGAFVEHIRVLEEMGVGTAAVRLPSELEGLDGLIIPGGESTTIMNLVNSFALFDPLRRRALSGWPIWGTCAGMIVLADRISDSKMKTLAVMDMEVRRNAFGRQIDSFEVGLPVAGLGEKPFPAIFIRAPIIEKVGRPVTVMATVNDKPAAARQGNLLVSAFHPELTTDQRFHEYFIQMAKTARQSLT